MSFLARLKTGLVLTKDALALLRHHPSLALFPLVSGATGLAFLGIFLGTTFGVLGIASDAGGFVILGVTYLVLTFVSSFFAAGLVHQTRVVLSDAAPSLRDGIAAAWDVKGKLFAWALISATVGIVINAIESSDSLPARLLGSLFGIAWTLLTFFVVPVVVFEDTSITGMFEESASTFTDTWGETPISLVAIQLLSFAVAIPFAVLGYVLLSVHPLVGIGVVLAGVLFSFLIDQTLQGVVKTTLYLYATEGDLAPEFDDVDLDGLSAAEKPSTVGPRTGGFH